MIRPSTRSRSRHGFTLVELLVAVFLMLVLGVMLISMLRQVVDITYRTSARANVMQRANAILSRVERDLVHLHGGPEGRMVSGLDQNQHPFIAFVRAFPEEASTWAGYRSGYQRIDDESEEGFNHVWRGGSLEGRYRAFGGLCEVAWLAQPEGFGVLRAVQAPIGRAGPFVRADQRGLIAQMEDWYLDGSMAVDSNWQQVGDGVLHLGFELWGQETQSWATSDRREGRAYFAWESLDASRLKQGQEQWPFRRDHEESDAPQGLGFPEAIRIVLTLQESPNLPPTHRLQTAIASNSGTIALNSADDFPSALDPDQAYLRIGNEWIQFTGKSDNLLTGCVRGARGTIPADHGAGDPVYVGTTFTKVVRIPVER